MSRLLGRPSSDGSYWTINLHSTANPSSPWPTNLIRIFRRILLRNFLGWPEPEPAEGRRLKIDVRIKRTCRVVESLDEHGNPSQSSLEFQLYQTVVPTLNLPADTMTRTQCASVLHQWLHYQPALQGDVANHVTDHVMEHVFQNNVSLHENFAALHVKVELNHVSVEHVPSSLAEPEPDLDQFEDDDVDPAVEGLSESVIKMLLIVHRFLVPEDKRCQGLGDCSICHEDLVSVGGEDEKNCYVFKAPCKHVFHNECIKEWVRKSNSCPLCRSVMSSKIRQFWLEGRPFHRCVIDEDD